MNNVCLKLDGFLIYLTLFIPLSSCVRRKCVQEQLPRLFSRWWTEQMAVSSALDTLNWVKLSHTHTHTKTTKSELGSWVFFSECDHRCVGSSLGRRSTSPHLSERERRGLVSAEAESILSLLCLCFCLPFSPSNPSEAGCQRSSLKKGQGPSLHSATCLIPDIRWDKQRPTKHADTHTNKASLTVGQPLLCLSL